MSLKQQPVKEFEAPESEPELDSPARESTEDLSPPSTLILDSLEPSPTQSIRGHRTGRVVGWDDYARCVLVDFAGNPHGPQPARSLTSFDSRSARHAAESEVLLTFDEERSDRPIIVGVFPNERGVREASTHDGSSAPAGFLATERASQLEARLELDTNENVDAVAKIDGRRVRLEAIDELELRCGDASIVLKRNGRVTIRGAYIETNAEGVNRIKGGAVRIN